MNKWKKHQQNQLLKSHQPCDIDGGCGSSDGMGVYEDGKFCFVCHKYEKNHLTSSQKGVTLRTQGSGIQGNKSSETLRDSLRFLTDNNKKEPLVTDKELTQQYINLRGIPQEVYRKYKSAVYVDHDGLPTLIKYPYGEGKGYKVRNLLKKDFRSEGDMSTPRLFGMELFPQGSAKALTICEGEQDAMACFYMQGSKYPSVSVRSSSQARKDCEANFKYINSFDLIYVCFDNDEPGKTAAKEVAELFDVNKVRVVHLDGEGLKDANDYLLAGKTEAFNKAWWNAKKYLPEGVVSSYQEIEDILNSERESALVDYPFPTLNEMTYGIRSKEVVLLTAQEGIGKTEVIRAIEYDVLKNTDYNIGIIHLEEEDKRSVQGLVSYELGVPCHLPDSNVSVEDQLKAYKALTRKDGRVYYYSHFGTDDPDGILDVIRYLVVTCGCKFIFLDHITMMVTGLDRGNDDERKLLDYLSTRLAMMVHQHDFALIMISHINDDGKTRGSRNISKVAHLHIQLDRDKLAETFEKRNTTKLTMHKNRFGYKTGDAGYLLFDPHSFTISEKTVENASESISPF